MVYLKYEGDKTNARDKYIVVSICDDMCQVPKFTQSQFQSETYDVSICACYPVTPQVPMSHDKPAICDKGVHISDSGDS